MSEEAFLRSIIPTVVAPRHRLSKTEIIQQLTEFDVCIVVALTGLVEWRNQDLFVQCRKKAALQIIQHVRDFLGRLKNEMFYGRSWKDVTIEKFIEMANEYIIWYAE